MSDPDEVPRPYSIESIPVNLFTGGLDFDQERGLAVLTEAMDRGSEYLKAMADGNPELLHEFEPLHRLLHGISLTAIIPIMRMIEEGASPPAAMCAVIAGIGGMFFFGGIEYAKSMGYDGVGVDLPVTEKSNDEDPQPGGINYYPENKPPTVEGLPEDGGLDSLLQRFMSENPYDESEE